nr:MAG: HTH-type transcriptional activator IlvY [Pseudomonadota bacterium]
MSMDYDALRLFVHLARTLHFTRTSRECHISLSALSRTIQRLEAELGRPLFARDRRSVALTPEGELFYEHAVETLERFRTLKERVATGAPALAGTLRIFASVTAVQSFLPRVLRSFRRAYPNVQIELETGYAANALAMLDRGGVDVTVAAVPERVPAGLLSRVVVVTPLVFVAPSADSDAAALVALRPVPWERVPIILPAAGLVRTAADRWFKRRKVAPQLYGEVMGHEALLSLVSLGCGVGVVPRLVADRSPLRAELRVIDVEPGLGDLRVGICIERRALKKPIVRAFWDSIDRS